MKQRKENKMSSDKSNVGGIYTTSEKVSGWIIHFVMILLCIITAVLFLVVVGVSFQNQTEINEIGFRIIPKKFSLEAYETIFKNSKSIVDAYSITILTTVVGAVAGAAIMSGYAYAISRRDFKYRKFLSWVNLITMLFNGGLVATYIVYTRWFGLKNNILVLILPLMFNPWNVILMKSFFSSIPMSIIEAAKIDGASEFRTFLQIVIPMSKPVIAMILLFQTLVYWNDYQSSLMYTTNEALYKLQYLLMKILTDMDFINSGMAADAGVVLENVVVPTKNVRMAMCVVAAGPMLCIFPFFQKYFTKGITLGGVKE